VAIVTSIIEIIFFYYSECSFFVNFVFFVVQILFAKRENMNWEPIDERDEALAHQVIGAGIEVHRFLGPGFIESIYSKAMEYELGTAGLLVEREKEILVPYKDIRISGQRLDLLVGGRIIVELKAVESIAPIHEAQLISYLKSTGLRLGLIVNFRVPMLKDGVRRIVH
jgi:GxxExxY protein